MRCRRRVVSVVRRVKTVVSCTVVTSRAADRAVVRVTSVLSHAAGGVFMTSVSWPVISLVLELHAIVLVPTSSPVDTGVLDSAGSRVFRSVASANDRYTLSQPYIENLDFMNFKIFKI